MWRPISYVPPPSMVLAFASQRKSGSPCARTTLNTRHPAGDPYRDHDRSDQQAGVGLWGSDPERCHLRGLSSHQNAGHVAQQIERNAERSVVYRCHYPS